HADHRRPHGRHRALAGHRAHGDSHPGCPRAPARGQGPLAPARRAGSRGRRDAHVSRRPGCTPAGCAATIGTMSARNRAVVSVIGRDQKGVVARVSTYLASCDINIEDIEQKVMEGLFIMTMLVDLSELSCTLDELVDGLKRIGAEISMEVKLRLASS